MVEMMATEISIPMLTESTNYELWKLQTQAWTVVTELSKDKQAIAVALNLPEDDKTKVKENVFGELELDVLNSENGMSVLFEFLDRYLLKDELMNSWNKFEDFEKFERKHGQNIREYVADFDLKFRKLEKLHIKFPSEILAFKLLRNANWSKARKNAGFDWCALCRKREHVSANKTFFNKIYWIFNRGKR